jgi:hypothetical protein
MTKTKQTLPETWTDLINLGLSEDKCSKKVLLDRVSFNGEKIVMPDGMSFRILMFPDESSIDLDVLKKAEACESRIHSYCSPPKEGSRTDQLP